VWSPETFAKFFVKRARCAPVLIVGLLLSPRRRPPCLSCDGCSAVPRRWTRHVRPGQSPLHHGTDAAWHCSRPLRGSGASYRPWESHPSSAARARSALGASAKPSPARHRCAPLGLTWFGSGLAGRATRRDAGSGMLAMSQDNRPFPGSPLGHTAGLAMWTAGCISCPPLVGRPVPNLSGGPLLVVDRCFPDDAPVRRASRLGPTSGGVRCAH